MNYGYLGKLLRVNLSTGSITIEEPDESIYRKYLGGGAFATYYLLKELKPGIDPLGPDNKLIFAASIITGSPIPGASRFTVAAKSPLTGGFGEAEAGGWWAPELKFAGFDAIIVEGKAPKPVYLWIHDGEAEIRDASHIWGKTTGDAEEAIRTELGDAHIRVAQIGPAGENLVRYACVLNNLKHANGRAGMGAVMGSKNLRAIAVRGTKRPAFKDEDGVRAIARWFGQTWKSHPGQVNMNRFGTSGGVTSLDATGILPTRNFITGTFEEAEAISGQAIVDKVLVAREGCYACPVKCKRVVEVKEPYSVDPKYGGPEYETVGSFGSVSGVGGLAAISKANEICNMYGLDTISAGMSIAFAMECYENGLLTKEDTGGIDLRFGDADAMLEVLDLIIKREGIGDLLAEGVLRASRKLGKGSERYAMHVKGQELPMHEPRGKTGVGLAYAVSPTGADHMEAPHDPIFTSEGAALTAVGALGIIDTTDPFDLSDKKVRLFVYLQQVWNLYNSIGICDFVAEPSFVLTFDKLVELVEAITGWKTSLWDLMKVGERANAMSRIFNIREGIDRKADTLPERLFGPLESGALEGVNIDRDEFESALTSYYRMVGWDDEAGIPRKEKLEELNIGWAWEIIANKA